MEVIKLIIQIVVALGIFNVWILRYGQPTEWRGGDAANMREEFETYGLPQQMMYVVGFLKLLSAILLVIGIWVPRVIVPAALVIAVLMIGAIAMHFKVGDPLKKSLPAFIMLVLSLLVAFL